jgi:cytochrome c-type biogenesis protein CcmH/NrfG
VQYENDARDAMMRQDVQGAISSLRSAVNQDPKFARAWLLLGSLFYLPSQQDEALEAYRSGVNADPSQAVSYKLLGFTLMRSEKFQEAVSVWQSLQKISPEDNDAALNLGSALLSLKQYREASAALEAPHVCSSACCGNDFLLDCGQCRRREFHAGTLG